MRRWLWLCALAALVVLPHSARAQTATDLLASAIRSYQNLDLDDAAGLIRRALAFEGPDALTRPDQAQALMYLTAIEVLRDHPDSARAIARRLVLIDPRYRPSDLLFPARVISLYDEARRASPVVTARAAADTVLRPGKDDFLVRLFASTFHTITAALAREAGAPLRTLYSGPIGDSLDLRWDGRDSTGAPLGDGRYALVVTSRDPQGRTTRILRVPLQVVRVAPDTQPLPPPPGKGGGALLPERRPIGPALRAFAPAGLAGAAIAALPKLVAGNEGGTGGRLVVGGVVSIAGIYAFFRHHPGEPLPQNAAKNQVVRDQWRAERDRIGRENATRRGDLRLHVRAGDPIVITPEAP
jgi:hypothetical protein